LFQDSTCGPETDLACRRGPRIGDLEAACGPEADEAAPSLTQQELTPSATRAQELSYGCVPAGRYLAARPGRLRPRQRRPRILLHGPRVEELQVALPQRSLPVRLLQRCALISHLCLPSISPRGYLSSLGALCCGSIGLVKVLIRVIGIDNRFLYASFVVWTLHCFLLLGFATLIPNCNTKCQLMLQTPLNVNLSTM
jgi:hypothetical protein